MRRKSRMMVAFGSCAHMGGIPGLANLAARDEILSRAYLDNPSIEHGNRTVPQVETKVASGALQIPAFYKRVYRLSDVVDVDYFVPGCPPAPEQVKAVVLAVAKAELPPRGSVVGASDRAVCDDCKREKKEKKVKRFRRPWEVIQDPTRCLMDQGIVCAGSATRSGCGVRCPNTGVGCRGCYGPLPNVTDQGAKILSAVSSIIDSKDPEEIARIIEGIPDFVAIAYRFGFPASQLQRNIQK